MDGGHEPRGVGLQDVVDRAAAQSLDGALLADRAREEYEGNVRRLLLGDIEGGKAVEARQGEVGKDDVRPELPERRAELPLVGHGAGHAGDAAAGQVAHRELGLGGDVLDDEQPQAIPGNNRLPCRPRRGTVPRARGSLLPRAFSRGSQLSRSDNVCFPAGYNNRGTRASVRPATPAGFLDSVQSSPMERKSRPRERSLR